MPGVKKATAKKKSIRKKTATRRTVKKTTKSAALRKQANASRKALTAKLREDLKATKAALRDAKNAAKEEIKLTREAAKSEIAVLKVQLNAALKREQELMKIAQNKAKMMLEAGEKWEKAQMKKLQKLTGKKPARRKRRVAKEA